MRLQLVWMLFRRSAHIQRKRMAMTVAAIAWGTISIVLLLSFGEGMKRNFEKNRKGLGDSIVIVWAGQTSKPFAGPVVGCSTGVGVGLVALVVTALGVPPPLEAPQAPNATGASVPSARAAQIETGRRRMVLPHGFAARALPPRHFGYPFRLPRLRERESPWRRAIPARRDRGETAARRRARRWPESGPTPPLRR